jgi:hypothetical protein
MGRSLHQWRACTTAAVSAEYVIVIFMLYQVLALILI